MKPEVIDFGILMSSDSKDVTGLFNGVNFDASFANWLVAARGISPSEARNTAYRVKALSDGNPPRTVEDATKLGMKVLMNAKSAAATKYGQLYAIERWMAYIGSPVKFAHKPRATKRCPTYLTQEQLGTLIRASRDHREFALLGTFIYTGARLNEVRMLDVGDVDFTQKHIHIRHAKRDKERMVPLDATLERIMRAYLTRRPEGGLAPDKPLFTTSEGERLSTRQIARIVEQVASIAGLKDVHPHVLRHSFATAYVENGGDVFSLQKVLGHADLRMTLRYWHYNQGVLNKKFGESAPRL
jgi:site-specific recombinase XerD